MSLHYLVKHKRSTNSNALDVFNTIRQKSDAVLDMLESCYFWYFFTR